MTDRDSIRVVAGVLVGGRGTRLGRPKAALPLPGGGTLVEHVVGVAKQMAPAIEDIVLLGSGQELPGSLGGLSVLADHEPGGGPLGGLCALLEFASAGWGLLLACDLPRLQPALLDRLLAEVPADCDAAAFRRTDRPNGWHTCCALYHSRLLPAALRELRHGRRSLQSLLAASSVMTLAPSAEEEQMLTNLNRPEDYNRLFSTDVQQPIRRSEQR